MDESDLKRELERLAARLDRIERRLNIEPGADIVEKVQEPSSSAAPATRPPPSVPPQRKTPKPLKIIWPGGSRQAATPPLTPPTAPVTLPPLVAGSRSAPSPPPPVSRSAPVSPPESRSESNGLEMLIGGKWMAWVGALTVVLAAAFAIMVGVREGWWGRISPGMRCLGIAAFGGLLMAGGEVALRKIGKAASAGLFAAGLGTLYLDSFAAFRPFNLISQNAAFPLLGAVALAGFAITLRTRFLSIGVLSLIGGYLAPILLWQNSYKGLGVPLYLTMLFGIALGLSASRPESFRPLRYVALGCQFFVGLHWILDEGPLIWRLAMVFMAIWAAMLLAEAIMAALREQSALGNVVASVLGTAGFVTAGCWLLDRFQPAGFDWLGAFTVGVGLLNAAGAAQFGPGLDTLRGRVRTAMDKLALALWIQAGVLLTVAIALQFEGFGQSIGWLIVGLAAIEVGRRLPSRGVTIFGLIVGGLAVARVMMVDWWVRGMRSPLWTVGDVEVNRWSILVLATILVVHVAAHRVRAKPQAAMPGVLALVGTVVWLILCAAQCEGLTATAGWLMGSVILLALHRVGMRQRYLEIAMLVILVTAGRWLALDAFLTSLQPARRATDMLPLLNWQMALAGAIAAAGWWAGAIMRRQTAPDAPLFRLANKMNWERLLVIVTVFGLLALSFEVNRALERIVDPPSWLAVWHPWQLRGLWWTALWATGGLGLALIGHRSQGSLVTLAGWTITAAAAAAWLTYDTLVWRFDQGAVPATVIANLQFIVGALTGALLGLATALMKRRWTDQGPLSSQPDIAHHVRIGLGLLAAIGLWLGSLEIDRLFAHAPMQRQTGLSVYWGLYGVLMVMIGFFKRVAAARYIGLGLLGVTLAKAFIIDMKEVELIWKAVIFAVVGLLLIGTSMVYIRLAPRLLKMQEGTGSDRIDSR